MTHVAYSNVERALLQFIMASGPIKRENLVLIHQKLKAEFNETGLHEHEVAEVKNRDAEDCVEVINDRLRDLGFEIITTRSQDTQEMMYMYVNTSTDIAAQNFTAHTKPEVEAIKKMIEKIFADTDGEEQFIITSKEAHGICRSETNKSSSEIELFLRELVNEGWFDTVGGVYFLSTKALSELRRALLDQYGAKTHESDNQGLVNICEGCREIVTRGLRCPNSACNVRFHKKCQANFVTARGSQCPGPTCNIDWKEHDPSYVGEKAIKRFTQYVDIEN